jgi:hypothetical protein
MPYNLNFPQAPDYMRDSQPLMLTNYASIFTFINADHVPFNSGFDTPGNHQQMTFPILDTDVASNGNWQLYGKKVPSAPFATFLQLFAMNPAGVVRGFTDSRIVEDGHLVSFVQLPSGIILKWLILPMTGFISNPNTVVWANYEDTKPFTNQYWAIVVSYNTTPSPIGGGYDDEDIIYYVISTLAGSTTYNAFERKGAFIGITPNDMPLRLVFAIGV